MDAKDTHAHMVFIDREVNGERMVEYGALAGDPRFARMCSAMAQDRFDSICSPDNEFRVRCGIENRQELFFRLTAPHNGVTHFFPRSAKISDNERPAPSESRAFVSSSGGTRLHSHA